MTLFQKRSLWDSGKVQFLPINQVHPDPQQPRKYFDPQELDALSTSIGQLGILQPLTVRRCEGQWQLVAGERRLRAASMAGLSHVPCLAISSDSQTASLLSLVENLQRRDLNFLEEAQAIRRLVDSYHLSQEQVAQRLGRSQSSVANKLRLLKLPPEVLAVLSSGGATERHARALLRLPQGDILSQAVDTILKEGLTVAQTEQLVEQLLAPPPPPKPAPRKVFVPKDVRLFLNTIQRSLKLMQTAGVAAQCQQETQGSELVVTIRIPGGGVARQGR